MSESKSVWQTIEDEFDCEHLVTQIRVRGDSLGRKQYFRQCLDCGAATSSALKHSSVKAQETVPYWDYPLADKWEGQKSIRRNELMGEMANQHASKKTLWWEKYKIYLKSDAWKAKCAAVLARDRYKCTARLPGCFGRATITHHLTYNRVFNEPLFDLTAVCSKCHDALHVDPDPTDE